MCTVYDINNRDASGVAKMTRELAGYDGFLSSCRFLDDNTIITGSGDMKMYKYHQIVFVVISSYLILAVNGI